jgi:hypothetical protein
MKRFMGVFFNLLVITAGIVLFMMLLAVIFAGIDGLMNFISALCRSAG